MIRDLETPVSAIWPVAMVDADWVINLAEQQYGRSLDHQGCKDFIADAITAQRDTFFCRSAHAIGMAARQKAFFDPAITQVHMLYLIAMPNRHLAGYRMLLAMAAWARAVGADSFHFGSTTPCDLGPFARRLAKHGVQPDQQAWTLSFRNS